MNKDIKSKIKAILKRKRFFYLTYYYVMSLIVNLIKIFVSCDEKLILFVSFGGRRCTDSPRAIYDYMLTDPRFSEYKLVWGVINPKDFPDIPFKVKIDSLRYLIISLKARCWITNVLIERGLRYTGKNTFYLYTGHGSPIKKCGADENNTKHFKSAAVSNISASLSQSEFERKIRSRNGSLPLENVYMTGAPTNDILVNYDENYRERIRKQLEIGNDKIAILYAPTFREYQKYGTFDMPEVNFEKWHEILGNKYVILYRAHPIAMYDGKSSKNWFIDVTSYERIESLMIASDMLVSDYSGLIPDYSITGKPIFLWTYDYDRYEKERGLYFDIRKELRSTADEDQLLDLILHDDLKKNVDKYVIPFRNKYATEYGSGTQNAVDLIYRNIRN